MGRNKLFTLVFLSLTLLINGCRVNESTEPQKTAVICDYEGERYDTGTDFPANDGCNECNCDDQGEVVCTLQACVESCNYEGETYETGMSFLSRDGCEECSCSEMGVVECSSISCAETDADNDGVPASADCDDDNAELGSIEVDADCDGAITVDDCDDEDLTDSEVCLSGQQIYTGSISFSFNIPDFPFLCDGEISLDLLYPPESGTFPSMISGSGYCIGTYGNIPDIDISQMAVFTSFFEAEGALDIGICTLPWTGELSDDGVTFNATSEIVECTSPGSLLEMFPLSFEFSTTLTRL